MMCSMPEDKIKNQRPQKHQIKTVEELGESFPIMQKIYEIHGNDFFWMTFRILICHAADRCRYAYQPIAQNDHGTNRLAICAIGALLNRD